MKNTFLFFAVLFMCFVGLDAMDQKTALVAAAAAANTNSRPKLTRTLSDSALHLGAISRAMVENDVVTCALKQQLQEAQHKNATQARKIEKRDVEIQELVENLAVHQNVLEKTKEELILQQLIVKHGENGVRELALLS